jgi:hypothetical protein
MQGESEIDKPYSSLFGREIQKELCKGINVDKSDGTGKDRSPKPYVQMQPTLLCRILIPHCTPGWVSHRLLEAPL